VTAGEVGTGTAASEKFKKNNGGGEFARGEIWLTGKKLLLAYITQIRIFSDLNSFI